MADQDKKAIDSAPSGTDPDRSAILNRRKQFIAVALAGLATTSPACISTSDGPSADESQTPPVAKPSKCLSMLPPKKTKKGRKAKRVDRGAPARKAGAKSGQGGGEPER